MLLFINYSYKKNYAENSISTLIDHNMWWDLNNSFRYSQPD